MGMDLLISDTFDCLTVWGRVTSDTDRKDLGLDTWKVGLVGNQLHWSGHEVEIIEESRAHGVRILEEVGARGVGITDEAGP